MLGKLWAISKKTVWFILLFCSIAIAGSVGKQLAKAWMTKSDTEKLTNVISESVKTINSQSPKQLDPITRIDRTEAVDGYKVRAYYTLINYQTYAQGFKLAKLKELTVKKLCTNKAQYSNLQLGLVWEYVYKQENGAEVGRFEIGKADCLGNN
ncbi:hypothetical protein ACTXOX_24355 [Pseudomonas helleri]|uniref:hypothetical protein n=1 Tax=Pseudomonas helleri TaxID=1608996 RepID=UPI003FCF59A1